MESDKSLGVAKLRTEICLLKDSVHAIQDSIGSAKNGRLSYSNTLVSDKSKKKSSRNNKVTHNNYMEGSGSATMSYICATSKENLPSEFLCLTQTVLYH